MGETCWIRSYMYRKVWGPLSYADLSYGPIAASFWMTGLGLTLSLPY